MMIRTALSDAARARLVAFCADTLRADLNPTRYADGLEGKYENWSEPVVFEIAARDTKAGCPATISFDADEDFRTEHVE